MNRDIATQLVEDLRQRGLSIATAESLTAGRVAGRIADVPGASAVLRGGVTTYATQTKATVLGVDVNLLDHVVSRAVAEAMARGAMVMFESSIAVATTGVAGPDSLDDQPPGTAWIAVASAESVTARKVQVPGDRAAVQDGVTEAALLMAAEILESTSG